MERDDSRPDDVISIGHGDPGATQESRPGPAAQPPGHSHPPGAQPSRWFVARTSIGDRTVRGPYEENVIVQMLQWGQLSWDDQVSRGANDPWRPIAQVRAFAQPNIAPAPPPPPPPDYAAAAPYYYPPGTSTLPPFQRHYLTAGLLGIILGGLGIHKFYNGSWGWGVLYLILCWTFIPAILGLIEGIMYLVDPRRYDLTYNRTPPHPWKW